MFRARESFWVSSAVAGSDDGVEVFVKAGDVMASNHPFVLHCAALFDEIPDDAYAPKPPPAPAPAKTTRRTTR